MGTASPRTAHYEWIARKNVFFGRQADIKRSVLVHGRQAYIERSVFLSPDAGSGHDDIAPLGSGRMGSTLMGPLQK